MKIGTAFLMGVVALFCHNSLWAQPLPVHEYQLKNGLKLFVKEDHRSPVVVAQVWYKVGSSYEPIGLTGISHALEHMMYKGTTAHPGMSFSKMIAAQGGRENAATSYDFTYFYQQLAKDRLPISFMLEADRMQNLALKDADFKQEIEVVKEERRLRTDNDPQSITFERFAASAFLANPYHHSVIGWMNDLNNMTVADLRDWYHHWYVPNNALLVVVGDVNPDKVYALAKQYFEAIPAKPLPRLKPFHDPVFLGERSVVVHYPAELPLLILGYNVPSLLTVTDPKEAYALEAAEGILAGGTSARLSEDLVRSQQIASHADADYNLYGRLPGVFLLYGIPSQHHSLTQLRQALLAEVRRLQDQLVSPQELQRFKNQAQAQTFYDKDSLLNQAIAIGSLEAVGLNYKIADDYASRIAKVTAQEIQAAARKYLTPDRLTTTWLFPLPLANHAPVIHTPVGDGHVR
jgi:zinc protease